MKETSSQPQSGPTRRILLFVSTVLLVLACVSPSIADDRTGLEYLIFRLEALPDDSPAPANLQNKLLALKEISGSAAPTGQGHTLVGEFGALGSAKERLNQSPRYLVILHAQAQRTAAGRFAPVRFRIKKGKTESDIQVYFQLRGADTRLLSASIIYAPTDSQSIPQSEAASDQRQSSWVIRDTRKINAGEVNYIDHPRFGMLVVATHPD